MAEVASTPVLETRAIAKAYGTRSRRRYALRDVSIQVAPGELYVLMGLSGSGKSTLLRMLNRLVEPTDGTVLLDGLDLSTLSARALREVRNRRISMVFQHFALFPHRSVRENAAYGLRLRGQNRATALERADAALVDVGLAGWGDARPDELSGGMKQRVGLARALCTDADVLLMDEPFSALDPLIRRDMQDLLAQLSKDQGRTVVFVTHDLNEAMRLGDRITILEQGQIAQTGTAVEILTAPEGDYVQRFIGDVDRTKVLTAADVMTPATGAVAADIADGLTVRPEDTLAELAGRLSGTRDEARVVADGRLIGSVNAHAILAAIDASTTAATAGGRS